MSVPYAPTPLASPIINPATGGYGLPVPYLSPSQYKFAPTAMDLSNLVVAGNQQTQEQALSDVIRRSSALMDRYCFGADPSSKGASLCATMSVENAYIKPLQGEIRLICDYKPIIELNALAIGSDPSNLIDIDQYAAARIRFGKSTIFVPVDGTFNSARAPRPFLPTLSLRYGKLFAVWSYVNGYPHTKLAISVSAGDTYITVEDTNPAGGVVGIYPGTQLRIVDDDLTEYVTVESVNGSIINLVSPLRYNHELPYEPDFIPVTTLPADVEQAAIFMTTYLIKSRGDDALVIMEINEPMDEKSNRVDAYEDLATAMEYLDHYRTVTKIKS